MYAIYLCCLVTGIIFLLLSVLSTGITDIFSAGLGGDFGSDFLSGILPFSTLEIFAFMIGFGGMGLTFFKSVSWHLIIAIGSGLLLGFLTRLVLSILKKVDSSALAPDDLIGTEGIVVVSILENSVGSVSFDTKIGKIAYSAKSATPIKQGEKVRVIAIEDHTMIVSNELENL